MSAPRLSFLHHARPVSFRADVAHTDPAPNTTRELLRHLGWLMEEVVRGSQEKVGVAQAAYDSVSRRIFFLLRFAKTN